MKPHHSGKSSLPFEVVMFSLKSTREAKCCFRKRMDEDEEEYEDE